MIEEIAIFGDPTLSGVLCRPDKGVYQGGPGIVLLSPGLLHRVGPNRIYVRIARALAADGFPVLRFDFSGQGDSPPRVDHLPAQQSVVAETIAAINFMQAEADCSNIILIGHCSGALASLLASFTEPRVAAVIAISPEGGDEEWVEFDRRQKEARYYANYYRRSVLVDGGRWKRLLTGRANYSSIARNFFRNIVWYRISTHSYRLRKAGGSGVKPGGERADVREFKEGLHTLASRSMPILLIHPDQSAGRELLRSLLGETIDEMHEAGDLDVALISASDHMFTPLAAQRDLIATVQQWLGEVAAQDAPASLVQVSR